MSKLTSLKIDVTKLDKSRFFQGTKGTYCDLDVWINDEEDQYGYHASANQTQTKEEREAKENCSLEQLSSCLSQLANSNS